MNTIPIKESEDISSQNDKTEIIPISDSPSVSHSLSPEKKYQSFKKVKNIYSPYLLSDQIGIEQIICSLCHQICEEPVVAGWGCENFYCIKCLEFYYKNKKRACPKCNKETGQPTFISIISNNIKDREMRCVNYCIGCTWKGKLMEYMNHIQNECPKVMVDCPNKDCILKLRREEISKHLKKCDFSEYICDKCGDRISIKEKALHKDICLKEIIFCPQGCKLKIERGNLNLHKKQCECYINNCPNIKLDVTDKLNGRFKKGKLIEDDTKGDFLSCQKELIALKRSNEEYSSKIKRLEEELKKYKSEQKNKENFININQDLNNTNNLYYYNLSIDKQVKELDFNMKIKIPKEKNLLNHKRHYEPMKKYRIENHYQGKIESEYEYLNGKLWNMKEYALDYILINEMINGKGLIKEYHINGYLKSECEYLNGEKNGKGKEYDLDGNLIFEGEYYNGKRDGNGKEFNSNGQIEFEGVYLNGNRFRGRKYILGKLESQGEYLYVDNWDGKRIELSFGNKNEKIFEGEYLKRKIVKGKEYFSEKLRYEGEYLNWERSGKGKIYKFNGDLFFEGKFLNGKKNGKGKEYYNNDKLKFEGMYVDGKRNGKGKEYDINGKLIFEGEYSNGNRIEN